MANDKRAAIQNALTVAITVFAEKGPHRARIVDIARAARCSTETLYEAFENKAGLFEAALREAFTLAMGPDEADASAEGDAPTDGSEHPFDRAVRIADLFGAPLHHANFRNMLSHTLAEPQLAPPDLLQRAVMRRSRFAALLTQALEDAREQGAIAVGDAEVAAHLLLNAVSLYGRFDAPVDGRPTVSPRDAMLQALSAFSTPKGDAWLQRMRER